MCFHQGEKSVTFSVISGISKTSYMPVRLTSISIYCPFTFDSRGPQSSGPLHHGWTLWIMSLRCNGTNSEAGVFRYKRIIGILCAPAEVIIIRLTGSVLLYWIYLLFFLTKFLSTWALEALF